MYTQSFVINNQPVTYNHETGNCFTFLNDPFYKAGKILSWPKEYGTVGLGISKEIMTFVLKRKGRLIVRINNRDYWCNYDHLRDFINHNNTEYKVKNTWLYVISWKIFHGKKV